MFSSMRVFSAMNMQDEEDDETLLVGFSAGALYKRADFLDKEEAAKSQCVFPPSSPHQRPNIHIGSAHPHQNRD